MRSAAQRDGSIRQVDADGDVIMVDAMPSTNSSSEMSSLDFNLFDGAPISNTDGEPVTGKTTTVRRCHGKRNRVRGDIWQMQDHMNDTLSIDLVEEVGSITRLDIELLT
jgi:hypothetical protein